MPFPNSDRLGEKRRPALVASHQAVPDLLGRVWVATITSASVGGLGDVDVVDLPVAGLPVPSILRASQLATLDADRVPRILGHLSERDQAQARAALAACAGF